MSAEKKQGLSRRAFLKSSGLTVAAASASAGLLGAQPVAAQDAASDVMNAEQAAKKWSFEVPPAPIPDDQIAETVTADIVIVGAGVAGLVCANAAVENGAKVVLISAGKAPTFRGGSFHAPNSKFMDKQQGLPEYDVDKFFRRELSAAGYNVDQTKWWKFYNNSEEAINWLIDKMEAEGYETVIEGGNTEGDLSFPMYQPPASHCWLSKDMRTSGMAAEMVVTKLEKDAKAAGADIRFKTVAKQLVREDNNTGRVTAVIAQGEDEKYTKYVGAKAVVLATGDFSTDKEMMAKYCPWAMPILSDTGDRGYDNDFKIGGLMPGDGQKMGLWVGAAWQKTFPNAPMVGGGGPAANRPYGGHRGLVVNRDGLRYGNEDVNDSFCGVSVMHQPEMKAYCIWGANYAKDGAPWTGMGMVYGDQPIDPAEITKEWEQDVKNGSVVKADTIEALIAALGLPAEATKATIDRYNELAAKGEDEDFHKSKEFLAPISEGPFYGGAISVGFLTVLGGLRTNINMQVCDANDQPIPGLYNIGTMIGDFFGTMYTFRVEGNNLGANCLTFGYLTGRDIAKGVLS